MKNTKKMVIASLFIALAVAGSTFAFPVLGSKCSPIQHMINILSAIILGPWYAVLVAFIASIIRVTFGLGTLMAFPGSMCGAAIAGLGYKFFKKFPAACFGELLGTSIIGGLCAYPVALFIMGNKSAAIFGYIVPFLISSLGGTIIATVIMVALNKTKLLTDLQK